MSRISPITDELYTIDNIIFCNEGILYNFVIKNKYIELRYFLTSLVVGVVCFNDEFFMWDALSLYLDK